MNGRKARLLREEAGFKVHDKREYETWKLPRIKNIYQLSHEGKIDIVQRTVDCSVIECVSGTRKIYQHLKRFVFNINVVDYLNVLPEQKELDAVVKGYKEASKKQSKEAKNE